MNAKIIINYDLLNLLKNKVLIIVMIMCMANISVIVLSMSNNNLEINGEKILRITVWIFSILFSIILSNLITNDYFFGTIQQFLTSKNNRIIYFIAKLFSFLSLSIFFFLLNILYTYIMCAFLETKLFSLKTLWDFFITYFLSMLVIYSLLYLINIITNNTIITYIFSVMFLTFLPITIILAQSIPSLGDVLKDIIMYVPFMFLPYYIYNGIYNLSIIQIILSVLMIFVLYLLNYKFTIIKDV